MPAAAWQTTPTTIILGERDQLVDEPDRNWINSNFDDVRLLDADHFIPFTPIAWRDAWSRH